MSKNLYLTQKAAAQININTLFLLLFYLLLLYCITKKNDYLSDITNMDTGNNHNQL
jgi:hypothetical protein